MAADPAMMADMLRSGGGAGPAPGGDAMPPVGGPPGAPPPGGAPFSSPEEAMAFLQSLGITAENAPMVAQALMMVQEVMGGAGGVPPGAPGEGAIQGPGGQPMPPGVA